MNRKHCVRFSLNMINSLSFSSQWKKKKETFEVSLLYRRLWIWSIEVCVKTVCYFHTILPTSFAQLLAWIYQIQASKGQNYCIHQWTPHLKPPWFCSVSASQEVKEIHKIWQNLAILIYFESHTWEQLKETPIHKAPARFFLGFFLVALLSHSKAWCHSHFTCLVWLFTIILSHKPTRFHL